MAANIFFRPSKVQLEIQRRINVAVWAYAYEFLDESIVSDHKFDEVCHQIDLSINTNRPDMDEWFRENFLPWTGQWIYAHPEKKSLLRICKETHKLEEPDLNWEF